MAEKRFKSKVDTWIGLLIVMVVGIDIVLIVLIGAPGPAAVLVGLVVLLAWLTMRTYYVVSVDTLRVVSGPFRWTIPLGDIQSVTPTRSLWSSPALSLDRLRIEYASGRRILVSPADKEGFLTAIGQHEH